MAPSLSSSHLWKYDIFLNFRGEDTRKSFVSHLYRELDRLGINTFKDAQKLETGKCISPELLNAIEASRFSIVVISSSYASSSWCLDELVKIMECKEKFGQMVIPIFYEVDPSDVRKQMGSFEVVFERRKERSEENLEKLEKWKEALTKVANIAGEDSRNWMDDSKLIQKIVRYVLNQLNSSLPGGSSQLVGMNAQIREMDQLLCMESMDEVRMIGIYGMGGIGKTTLARFLLKRLLFHFPAYCFIENVKEIFRNGGTRILQETFLSKILQERDIKLPSSEEGINLVKPKLGHLKVLVVLDDVDKLEHLNVLADNINWFGPGSRIIITTRDKHLLVAHGVKHVYQVKCLKKDEALYLFRRFAFRETHQENTFLKMSYRVVNCASGLPLALRVLGSFLCRRSKEEWECMLTKLERYTPKDIIEVLRVSYDGLDKQEQDIFLHLACLFIGEHVDRIVRLLDAFGYCTKLGIQVLTEKSLLEISSYGYIVMHDLLRKLGRELVCEKSTDEPEKRKFLWDAMEFSNIAEDNMGSGAIQGISLNLLQAKELTVCDNAFQRMPNLKFLKFYGRSNYTVATPNLPTSLSYLPRNLRLLHWDGCPLKALPLKFRPECLVEIVMPFNNLQKLWEVVQSLKSLREMNLSCSKDLKQLPDLSTATNLESLNLSYCTSLVEFPSSVWSLRKLSSLKLSGCRKINTKSLNRLYLPNSQNLERFSEIPRSIIDLKLSRKGIEELPPSFGHFCTIRLNLSGCTGLLALPEAIGNMTTLKCLHLYQCEMLGNIPTTVQKLTSLATLHVWRCPRLSEFPHVPKNIEKLVLKETGILEIPSWIQNMSRLKQLDASENKRLKSVPSKIFKLKSLESVDLSDCSNLKNFPAKVPESWNCLRKLWLSWMSIRELPAGLENLSCLLDICAENTLIECVSLSATLKCLKFLWLGRYSHKTDGASFQCPLLSNFTTLKYLLLTNLRMLEIPNDIGYLCNVVRLDMRGNDFETIPASIKRLSNLHYLCLDNCKKLRSLPLLPTCLIDLSANGCISLEKASPGFKHHIHRTILANCFKLHPDVELLVQPMASMRWFKEEKPYIAFLPGNKVPECFGFQAVGPLVTIRLPGVRFASELVGFIACIVVATVSSLYMSYLSARYHCRFKGKHGQKDFQHSTGHLLDGSLSAGSDHLLVFNYNQRHEIKKIGKEDTSIAVAHDEYSFDEISFEFYLPSCYGTPLCFVKIKECRVRPVFVEDLEEPGKRTTAPCSCDSSIAEEEPKSIEALLCRDSEEARDYSVSSQLRLNSGGIDVHLRQRMEEKNSLNVKKILPSSTLQ